MKKKIKYKNRLLEIALKGQGIAIVNDTPVSCASTDCEICECMGRGCNRYLEKWGEQEVEGSIDNAINYIKNIVFNEMPIEVLLAFIENCNLFLNKDVSIEVEDGLIVAFIEEN